MALNPKLLKTLISSADEAADAVSFAINYGDDAARLASKYGDDILRMAPKTERIPFKPTTAQLTERAKNNITKRQLSKPIPSTKHTKAGDALSELFDNFTSVKSLESVSNDLLDTPYTDKFGNAVKIDSGFPELMSYRKNPQVEIIEDSIKRRYPDSPKWTLHTDTDLERTFPVRVANEFDATSPATLDDLYDSLKGAPAPRESYPITTDSFGSKNIRGLEPDNLVRKSDFDTYNPIFEDSPYFPDGFASPDDFARYYDSLELGYTPSKFIMDSKSEMFGDTVDTDNWNDFYRAYYGNPPYADEGPLESFFREQAKLPKGISKQPPNRTVEEFFSNPMFWDDLWIK